MAKLNIFLILLFSSLLGCTSTSVIAENLTGQELQKKYLKLQNFIYTYESEERDGELTDTYVEVYKLNNKHCAIVGRTFGDSGAGGSEDVIFFKNSKIISATLTPFLNSELQKNPFSDLTYLEPFPNEQVTSLLEKKFIGYIKKMDKKTLNNCK